MRRWGWLGQMEEGQMVTRLLCQSLHFGLESEAAGAMAVS